MKLRYILLIVFGLATAVPLVLFWAWPHAQSMTSEMEDVRERHLLIAETMAVSLKNYHRDIIATFRLIYSNLVKHGSVEGAEGLLQDLYFRNVCVFDLASRRLRLRVDSFDNRCRESLSDSDLGTYLSLTSEEEVTLSPVMAGPEGAPTLYVAAETEGLLAVGALYPDFFVELGRSITFGHRGHAVIVDQAGQVLGHPNDGWLRERRNIAALTPVQRMLQGGSGVVTFHAPFIGEDAVAAYTVVDEIGWGVMLVQPLRELRERAGAISRSALIVVVIGTLSALTIGALVAYYMTRPLRAVSQAARHMAAGNAEVRARISGGALVPAEMRDLETSFNVMAESMERSKRDEHEARLRAEEASRSKSAFLANMSHELRTPLNAILGFSEVILAETFGKIGSPRYAEYMKHIEGSARHLLALINDLLDLSRIEAGAMKLEEDWIGLTESLEESASMFREQSLAGGLELTVDNRAGPLTIRADERALRQILINLLSNAVRHTPAGGRVVLGASPSADGGLDVYVADTGVGIPAADLKRVLEPFEQVAGSPRPSQEGTGLGLPIVKELVELHSGELTLESEVGKGTTVTFRLPPARVQARPVAKESEARSARAGSA